jgi:hypothetical protein
VARDYYRRLGVTPDAGPDEIKRAYRWRAKHTHTDTTGSDDASPFHAIQEAYEVLSDKRQREEYDAAGGDDIQPSVDVEVAATTETSVVEAANDDDQDTTSPMPPRVSPRKVDFGTVEQGADSILQQLIDVSNPNGDMQLTPWLPVMRGRFWRAKWLRESGKHTLIVTTARLGLLAAGEHKDSIRIYWLRYSEPATKLRISLTVVSGAEAGNPTPDSSSSTPESSLSDASAVEAAWLKDTSLTANSALLNPVVGSRPRSSTGGSTGSCLLVAVVVLAVIGLLVWIFVKGAQDNAANNQAADSALQAQQQAVCNNVFTKSDFAQLVASVPNGQISNPESSSTECIYIAQGATVNVSVKCGSYAQQDWPKLEAGSWPFNDVAGAVVTPNQIDSRGYSAGCWLVAGPEHLLKSRSGSRPMTKQPLLHLRARTGVC